MKLPWVSLLKEYSESKFTQVDIFNNLIGLIKTSELSQYVFLNYLKEEYDYEFFDFKVGNLNFDKIKYETLKAGSLDVYESFIKKEKNNLSIERKVQIVCILSFYEFKNFFSLDFIPPEIKGPSDNKLLYYLLNEYFFRLSDIFHINFCNDYTVSVYNKSITICTGGGKQSSRKCYTCPTPSCVK